MSYQDFYLKDFDWTDEKLQMLTPWEKFLLTRKPIIAPDGYIPNSVVRKRIRFVQPESPKPTWQLKPVPDFDPRYLPEGWHTKKQKQKGSKTIETIANGNETDKLSPLKETFRPRNTKVVVPMKNLSTDDPNKAKFDYHTGSRKVHRVEFNLNGQSEDLETQKTFNVNESKVNQLPSKEENAGETISENAKPTDTDNTLHTQLESHHSKSKKSPAREKRNKTRESKRKAKARENGEPVDLRISQEQNQEQITGIDIDKTTLIKRDENTAKDVGLEVLEKLLREDWFPLKGQHGLEAILEEILKLLESNDNDIFDAVCQYLVRIFQLFPILPELKTRAKDKLNTQLKNPSVVIVEKSKWALQQLNSFPDAKLSDKVWDGTDKENKPNETMVGSNGQELAPTEFRSDTKESQLLTSDRSNSPAKSNHIAKAKRKKHKRERSSSSKKLDQTNVVSSSEGSNVPASKENSERLTPRNKENTDTNEDNNVSSHYPVDNVNDSSSKYHSVGDDKNTLLNHHKIDNDQESSSIRLSIDNDKDNSSNHSHEHDNDSIAKHVSGDHGRTNMEQGQISHNQEKGQIDDLANIKDRQPSDASKEKESNLSSEDATRASNYEDINAEVKNVGIKEHTSAVRKLHVNIGSGAIGNSNSILFDGIGDLSSSDSDTDSNEHNQTIESNKFEGNDLDAHDLEGNDLKENHFKNNDRVGNDHEGNDHEGNTLLLNDGISQAAIVGSHTVIDFNAQSFSSISSKSSQKFAPVAIDEEIQFSNQKEKFKNAEGHLEIKRNTSFPSVSNVNPVQYTVIGGPAPQYNHSKKKKATNALDSTNVNDDHGEALHCKGMDDGGTTLQSHTWSLPPQQQMDQALVPFSSRQNLYNEGQHLPGGLVPHEITLPALPDQDTTMKKELLLAFCNGLPDISQHRRTSNLSPFHISDGELDRSSAWRTTSTQIASCHKGHECEHMRCAKKKMHQYISISKFLSNVSLSQRMSDLTSRPKVKEKTTFGTCRYTAVRDF